MDEELLKTIRDVSHAHLFYIMRNKGLFMKGANFSTVQYMNEKVHTSGYKSNSNVLKWIKRLTPEGSSFLNMGTAAGHLPWVNILHEGGLRIDNVEWDDQLECCEALRNAFGINISYTCNNVYDDDFVIRDCEEMYDYVILQRFFPVYQTNTGEDMRKILRKMKPYARKCIIVEANTNWSAGVFEDLLSFSERRVDLTRRWSLVITDLGEV